MELVPDIDPGKEESLGKYSECTFDFDLDNQTLIKLYDLFGDIEGLSDILRDKAKENKDYMIEECIRLFDRLGKALFIIKLIKGDLKRTVARFEDLVSLRAMWYYQYYAGGQLLQIYINEIIKIIKDMQLANQEVKIIR